MGAERTRSGFNARCLWSWLLADEDEQSGQSDASDVRRHPWKEAASFVAAAALVVAFFWYSLAQIDYRPDFSFLPDFRIRIWDGFLLTIGVSAAAMVLSLLLGILSAAAKLSRVLLLRDLFEPLCGLYPRDAAHYADLPFFLSGRDSMGR